MNKADYIALINSKLPDGTQLPSSDHRSTMYGDASSVAEMVYKDYITDYSETSPVITTPNSRFTYYATFVKVGNQVTITGNFTSIGIQAYGRTIFTIADLDYECIAERYFAIATDATTLQDRIGVFMTGTTFNLNSVALDGEKFNYTITYTALN